jgi:UDP-N-acetylglucosamine transferase subunit ALG13
MIKIAVLLGTQEFEFNRIYKYLSKLSGEYKIFIQRKDKTKIDFKYYIIDDYNYDEVIHKADVCIVHGGAGTIFKCLNENKKIIIFPRLKKYNEHIDDHQKELADKITKMGLAIKATNNIQSDIEIAIKYKNKKYKNNFKNKVFLSKIQT